MKMFSTQKGSQQAFGLTLLLSFSLGAEGCVQSAQVLGESIDESAPSPTSPAGGMGGEGSPTNDPAISPAGSGGEPGVLGPTGTAVHISGGDNHTCAVLDGSLHCWGSNAAGALGLGDTVNRLSPTRLGDRTSYLAVTCGGEFSCANDDGQLECFGSGSDGQLGQGEFESSTSPLQVNLPGPVATVDAGHSHVCAVLNDGTLYCWGNNEEGQLAQDDPFPGSGVNSASPLRVGDASDWLSVSGGQGHTCAIKTSGTLHCWGRNTRGELGLGDVLSGQTRVPLQVGTDSDWHAVHAGQNFTCGLKENGTVLCWGANSHGQLGTPPGDFSPVPTLAPTTEPTVGLSLDTFHVCVRSETGAIRCWGRGVEGQLGDNNLQETTTESLAFPEGPWTQVSAARFHTCAVRAGNIYCTGANAYGALGVGDTDRRQVFSPTIVPQ